MAKMLTCATCGDPIEGADCPRCNWGGWTNVTPSDNTANPPDPTIDMHRGIQASAEDWESQPFWLREQQPWSLGVPGKGFTGPQGAFTWRVGVQDRRPYHMQMSRRAEQQLGKPLQSFQINPNGEVWQIRGRDAITPEQMQVLQQHNPDLHDGSSAEDEFNLSKTADYQGWTNWDTWHTKLMMDNEYDLYQQQQQMAERGWTPEQIRDWAVEHVLGPHNKQQIADAREWNEIPEEERLDHNYEEFKDKHGDDPKAMDLFHGLVGGPDVSDEDPTLIDPELVNWQEIHQHIMDAHQEELEYERQQQENPPPPTRTQFDHLPPDQNPYHWQPGDVIQDRGGSQAHVQAPMTNADYLPMKHIAPTEYYHGEDFSLHPSALVNTYGYQRVGNEPLDKNWLADPSLDQPGNFYLPSDWGGSGGSGTFSRVIPRDRWWYGF